MVRIHAVKPTEAEELEQMRQDVTEASEVECEFPTSKTKILIFEDQWFSQIAMENILFDQLKLKKHVKFFMSGKAIKQSIESLYEEGNVQ